MAVLYLYTKMQQVGVVAFTVIGSTAVLVLDCILQRPTSGPARVSNLLLDGDHHAAAVATGDSIWYC